MYCLHFVCSSTANHFVLIIMISGRLLWRSVIWDSLIVIKFFNTSKQTMTEFDFVRKLILFHIFKSKGFLFEFGQRKIGLKSQPDFFYTRRWSIKFRWYSQFGCTFRYAVEPTHWAISLQLVGNFSGDQVVFIQFAVLKVGCRSDLPLGIFKNAL